MDGESNTPASTAMVPHTPGPWSVWGEPNDWPGIESADESIVVYGEPNEDDTGVRSRNDDKAEAWANAHLIAAAPELLEACKRLAMDKHPTVAAIAAARVAIAKAEGA